ncbi:MAG: zf-TFIIB domain-containing protein [Kofleriaceae bacterium]
MRDPYREPGPAPYREPATPTGLPCPRCGIGLAPTELAGTWLHQCERCDGQFVRKEVLVDLEAEPGRADEVVAELGRVRAAVADGGPMYVKCPRCAGVMNRAQYALGAKVVVDYCRADGVWFDGGELAKVLEFVAAGGLARARAEAERRRREAARQAELDRRFAQERWAAPAPDRWRQGDAAASPGILAWLVDLLT